MDTYEFMLKPSFRLYKNLPKEEREAKGINTASDDVLTGKLDIQNINIELKDQQSTQKQFQNADNYTFGIGPIKYDWEVMTTVSIYYILFDSLSDVGGLLALLKSALEVVAPIVLLVLLYDFSKVITRKSK